MPTEDHRSVDARRTSNSGTQSNAGGGVLVRLGWMVLGPTLLVVSTFSIAATPHWTFGWNDAVLALGAVLSVGFRYWDIRAFEGQTANGEPATMGVFGRYAAGLTLVVGACWAAAQSIQI